MEYCRLRHQFWSNDVNDVDVTSRTQCWSLQVSHQIFSSVEKPEMSSAFLPISAHFCPFSSLLQSVHVPLHRQNNKKKKAQGELPNDAEAASIFWSVSTIFRYQSHSPKVGPSPFKWKKFTTHGHIPWRSIVIADSYELYIYYVYIHHHPSSSIIIHHSSSSIIYQPPWNPRSRRIRETKEDEQRATHDLHLAIAHLRSQPPEDVPADSLTKLWAYETYRYI